MHIQTIKIMRPSTDVAWYSPDPAYLEHRKIHYELTKIILFRTVENLEDNLTKTIITIFNNSSNFYDVYLIDPVIEESSRKSLEYYSSIGATMLLSISSTDSEINFESAVLTAP